MKTSFKEKKMLPILPDNLFRVKVRTTKIRTSKFKKNVENVSKHQNIKKCLFSSSLLRHQNVESVFLVQHYYNKNSDF
jgi:hypothetical protein